MDKIIDKLKSQIIRLSDNPKFIHHTWFVKYHIKIVEKIAQELCEIYPEADKHLVQVMVWFHDYGKIINFDKQHETTQTKGLKFLVDLGFEEQYAIKVLEYIKMMDSYKVKDLQDSPIEVKIISSADGAAHLVGPFYKIYFKENYDKTIDELMKANTDKTTIEWERKIILPVVKRIFKNRYTIVVEQNGKLPDRFLKESKVV